MATPTTTNQLANIATYMWSCDILKKNAFGNGSLPMNNGRDLVLMVENAALTYGIEQGLSDNLGIGLNVYRLVGQMLQQANEVLSEGSGGIVPSPTPGGGSLIPFPITHTVTALQSGAMTLTNSAWIGLQDINQLVVNQSIFQYGVGFTFNSIIGQFDLSLSSYTFQQNDIVSSLGFMPTT